MSYYYSSPEVTDIDKAKVTPKSDVFSFAMFYLVLSHKFILRVLYELYTGKKAWKNFIGKGTIPIYNYLHNKSYNFFKENEKTGNLELDKLIFDCVQ